MLTLRNFFSGTTISNINRIIESIITTQMLFYLQPVYIEDSDGIADNNEWEETWKLQA